MTDKKNLYEIEFLKDCVGQHRATGRSTRLVDSIIQEFFTKPMGTIIPVADHFTGINFNHFDPIRSDWGHFGRKANRWGIMRVADKHVLRVVEGRLKNEHGGVKYKVITGNPSEQERRNEDKIYSYAIIRETPTFKEKLEQLQNDEKE